MIRDRRRLAALTVVAALALLAGCEGVPTQREVVCHGCVEAVENASSNGSGAVSVVDSVTHVRLQRSGDVRVVARMDLAGPAPPSVTGEAIRRDLTAAERASDRRTRSAFDRRTITARVEGDTVVLRFRARDVADRRFGAVLSDWFYRHDGDGRADETNYDRPFRIGTDRLVVSGPEGTRPLVDPPGATVRGDRVVWRGDEVPTRSYLVFGDDTLVPGRVVVAADVLAWAAPPAARVAAVPTLVLFALAGAFARYYPARVADRAGWSPRGDALFTAVGGGTIAILVALFVVFVGAVGFLFAAVVGALVVLGHRVTGRSVTDDGTPEKSRQADGDDAAADGDDAAGTDAQLDGVAHTRPLGVRLADRDGPDGETVRAVVASLAGVAAVTALVAVDFRAEYAATAGMAAAALPFVAFPALGYLVTDPARTWQRAVAVVATAAAPWLYAFATTVDVGAHDGAAATESAIFGAGSALGGIVLFYIALWVTTTVRSRRGRQ